MAHPRLQRKLRRINEAPWPPREIIGMACLVPGAAALAVPPGPAPLLALAAIGLATAWLRRYQAARPRAGAIARHLAVGAFLGGCFSALLVDPPLGPRAWLQWPALSGGPPVALVLLGALAEDLVRALRRALAARH